MVPVPPSPSSRCWPRARACAGPDADEPGEDGRAARRRGDRGRQLRGRRDRRGGRVRRPVPVGRQRPRRRHCVGAAAERGHAALRAAARRPVRGALPVGPRAALAASRRLRRPVRRRSTRSRAARCGSGCRPGPSGARRGSSASIRRRGDWVSRAGAGARQRRGRLDGDEPSAARLRALGDAREPEEAQRSSSSTTARPCARFVIAVGRPGNSDAAAAASRSPTSCG